MTNSSSQASLYSKLPRSSLEVSFEELEEKIDSITQFASRRYFNKALKKLGKESTENAIILCDYIIAEQTEINIKQSTKEGKIKILIWLSNFHSGKPFRLMTKQDILSFLNNLRKSVAMDPTQRWIGSYNGRQMILNKFFRWLYNPDEADQKKRLTPPCMQGVKKLPRKLNTRYKYVDMWNSREHAVFLKYCPDKRDQCYHAIAIDTSARPHEILNVKISDIQFHLTEDGNQYAEMIIKDGKTGSRTVPLIDSIPYVKAWINSHPSGTNPESWLFISKAHNSMFLKLTYDGIVDRYTYYYKKRFFPKLLGEKSIPESDKAFIRNMLTKPWQLYVFRHSSLTEKSQILSESLLKEHAGWSMSSNMPQIYVHLKGESSKMLLQNRGLIKKDDTKKILALRTIQCPNCNEPNGPESRFCIRCSMVLKYDAYTETIEQKQKQTDELIKINERQERFELVIQSLIDSGQLKARSDNSQL